jgi:hypothetical protein
LTYFTFADGALRYDCMKCGQACCRGRGFAVAADELVPLLGRVPRLASVLRTRPGGSAWVADLTDGCWFLQGDGNCSIEVEHGRLAKPSTCRLFPFNRVYTAGGVRVVDFNASLCPLEDASGTGVRHADLIAEIDALAGSPLVDVPLPSPSELPADWVERERAATIPTPPEAACGLYGARPDAAINALIALAAPSLRFGWLFRKNAGAYPVESTRLPERLAGLALIAAAAPHARALSLRGLVELWHESAGALDVLARWREPVTLRSPQFSADLPAALQPALGAFLAAAFRGPKPLGELVVAAAAALPETLRPLAVPVVASQLGSLS